MVFFANVPQLEIEDPVDPVQGVEYCDEIGLMQGGLAQNV